MRYKSIRQQNLAVNLLIREYISLIIQEAPVYPVAASGTLPQINSNSRLTFGEFGSPQGVYDGADDTKIVLKLSTTSGLGIDYAKNSLGARSVPPGYLVKTSRFMKDLSSELNPEDVNRQEEIILATNDAAVKRTKPFNSSESFYVLVDVNNKNLVNLDLKELLDDPAIKPIITLLSNPATGLGKIINSLPQAERDKVIQRFRDVAATAGVLSGGTSILSLLGSSIAKLPAVKTIAALSASISIGPMLALSSVAFDKGDTLEGCIYLFGALMSGVAGWLETLATVNAANAATKSIPGTKNAFELIAGRKVTKLEDLIVLLERIQETFPTYASWQLKRGTLKAITQFEEEFVDFAISNPTIISNLIKSIKDNLTNLWEILKFTFGAGITSYGLLMDLETLQQELINKPTDSSGTDVTKETSTVDFSYKFILDVHQKMMTKMKSNTYQKFYDTYRRAGYTACINASDSNLSIKYYPKISIGSNQPDFVITVKEYFDVFGTLIKYPKSLLNKKNIIINGNFPSEDNGRSIYIIPSYLAIQTY